RHSSLLALLNVKLHKQITTAPLVIINQPTANLHLMKSVCIVEGANGSHVILQQRAGVPSGGGIRTGLNLQSAGQNFRAEILIARKYHSKQAMVVATINVVHDDPGSLTRR